MEQGTPIKMVAMGATLVEKHNRIEFVVVCLLNPKILGEIMEEEFLNNMEPIERR